MGRSAQRPCIWTQYMPSGGAVVSWSCLSVRPGSLLAMGPATWIFHAQSRIEPTHPVRIFASDGTRKTYSRYN